MVSRIGLRLWPMAVFESALSVHPTATRAADVRLVHAFRRETRRLSRGRCLLMSVALLRLLRRRGMDARLRVGFDRQAASMRGHAWVESGDLPQGEVGTIGERFRAFNVTAHGLAAFVSRHRAPTFAGENS